jgi:two-component system response regulator (stage 0 sporulation protein A)
MAAEDEEVLVGITKGLYPDIAKMYKTSASKVERAIRHAIESAWKKNGPQVYFEVAGYLPSEKPTNGHFIAALSEYFRLQEERPKKIS